ncbi:hypothetical protein BOTBODRAFT_187916 [Botryobasidium botryosum FD-172 SS1]|uniref:5'-Nucleotidase C-terminal domain-containing protein n=1 Tax=Botryobasidium botryosum (strain FD-172 SS1) TaxID=930990 RepID=A0A067MEQ7_BOTB1|nr:hypothetical protein BOTBODRAFT_187916 [Botryobasidium botryosum FD-172 SS1]
MAAYDKDRNELRILHFNDVYKIRAQEYYTPKVSNSKTSTNTFDVTHFAGAFNRVRNEWPARDEGLVLFSGDVFNPSLDSAITQGSHMVPIIYQLGIDAAVPGNHEFDHGYTQLCKNVLARKDHKNDPWILSNMTDTETHAEIDGTRRKFLSEAFATFKTFHKAGIKVGVIGLVGDWTSTVSHWPEFIKYEDVVRFAKDLAISLRSEHGCDLVIALTHSLLKEDIALAEALFVTADSPDQGDVIDLILGGHDHEYYVGRGIETCQDFDPETSKLKQAETSKYPARIIKSGTDFHEFSEVTLELEYRPNAAVRRTVVKSVTVKRVEISPAEPQCPEMQEIFAKITGLLGQEDRIPLCRTRNAWDLDNVRTQETAFGNWLADETLKAFKIHGAQGVFLSSGSVRGEKEISAPKDIIVSDIREILLFPDPIVVIELKGKTIREAFEHGLDSYGAGPFPVFSGFRVKWSSKNPLGQRISTLTLEGKPVVDDEPYRIATQEYLRTGHDGYTMFKGAEPINPNSGVLLISVVFDYFLKNSKKRLEKLKEETDKRTHRAGDPEWQKPGKYWPGYKTMRAILPSWGGLSNLASPNVVGDTFLSLGHRLWPDTSTFHESQQPPLPHFTDIGSVFLGYQNVFSNLDSSTDQWWHSDDADVDVEALLEEDKRTRMDKEAEPVPFELPAIDGRLVDLK